MNNINELHGYVQTPGQLGCGGGTGIPAPSLGYNPVQVTTLPYPTKYDKARVRELMILEMLRNGYLTTEIVRAVNELTELIFKD